MYMFFLLLVCIPDVLYIKNMKYFKLLFLFPIIISCTNTKEIISKEYNYEKMLFDTHRFEFEIHLENIDGFDKASELIRTLIYQNKNFDEYAEYREKDFIEGMNMREEFFPPQIDEDGAEYFYRSCLNVNYSVEFFSDSFIMIKYFEYIYYYGAAHGIYWTNFYIIDIAEKKILDVGDLLNQIPDELIRQIIEKEYSTDNYLRENIWHPDTINFSNGKIELIWNIYQLLPYSFGMVSVEIPDDIAQQYLTEKGRILKMQIEK